VITRSSTRGPGSRRARLVCLLLLGTVLGSCGPARERFSGTFESPEALTRAFLEAVEARDRARLAALALSEREYRLEVFPEMPAYGNVPSDFAWSQIEGRNRYGESFVLAREGGRSWELEEIVFEGGTTAYQTFVVHRDPLLHLRDRRTGERQERALFGSILEHAGRYKLFSLNLDR
jgi:hypothetical protein